MCQKQQFFYLIFVLYISCFRAGMTSVFMARPRSQLHILTSWPTLELFLTVTMCLQFVLLPGPLL